MTNNSMEKMLKEYSETLVLLLETIGKTIKMIGEIERKTKKNIEEIMREFLKPETLVEISRKVPSDVFGEMMSLMLEIATLRLRDFSKLTSEEKIKLGEKIIDLAEKLRKLLNKLEAIK